MGQPACRIVGKPVETWGDEAIQDLQHLMPAALRSDALTAAVSATRHPVLADAGIFGLLSPAFTRLMLHAPKAFVMALAGLAMLRTLQAAFVTAFKDRFTLGALVAVLVTVADLGLLNIDAAFWGLLAGFVISWLLERPDFVAAATIPDAVP